MKHNSTHYVVMFIIMCISGLLSTMNIWADKLSDIRFSLNDVYMILLMNGWMLLFMSIYNNDYTISILGLILVIISIICIRTQFMIDTKQYINGMIPHHSMAVHISKKLLENKTILFDFANNIIQTQNNEINFMKSINV